MPVESSNQPINDLRHEIDRVDTEILQLLSERRGLSRRIALSKGESGRPSRDPMREEQMIDERLAMARSHDLDPTLIVQLWRAILGDSVRIQVDALGRENPLEDTIRVAIQGIEGSYSHLAATTHFRASGAEPEFFYAGSFAEAINDVATGAVDVGVLPIENSTSGAITEVYEGLLDSDLHIVGEVRHRVRHCLLGLPGATAGEIEKIYGHPQTIAQCSEFISSLRGTEIVYFTDTALSGKHVAELGDPTVGAIASEEAAELYGLEVLKPGIANMVSNTTRFVVVAAGPHEIGPGVPAKTSLVMAVGNEPGSLMHALKVFEDADINLVKLESRPIASNPQEELFYVDMDGSSSDPHVEEALENLKRHVRFLRVLGSYPSRDLRPRRPQRSVGSATPRRASIGHDTEHKPNGYTLGSRGHKPANTLVRVGGVDIGGDDLVVIAGPCAVESWEQVTTAARAVRDSGATLLRGGCFKPRTSPYSFQGLGFEGLDMLAEAGKAFGLPVVTEVLAAEHVEKIAEKADVLQIGTRNMQNFSLLQEVGRVHRPVLLKRGMSSSLDELLQAAEYILAEGNQQVILCERGIRTFETSTRNTLDISAVPVLKSRSHLPVIVDPSHAAGARHLVPPMALAAQAVGADGIMVEVHPDPESALSDGPQSLDLAQLDELTAALGVNPG